MKNTPKKIYLQIDDESSDCKDFNELIQVSWCTDKINEQDITYVREDICKNKIKDRYTKKEVIKLMRHAFLQGKNSGMTLVLDGDDRSFINYINSTSNPLNEKQP